MVRCRLLIVLYIVSCLLFCSSCNKAGVNLDELTIGDYLIISTTYSNPDYIKLLSFDANGELINTSEIYTEGSWKSKVIDDKILILGGQRLLIIDQKENEIYTVSSERPIEYAFINNELLVFVINYGIEKQGDTYRADVCKIITEDLNSNESFLNYECEAIGYVPLDISMNNDSIIITASDFYSLQEYLLFLDSELKIMNTKPLPTSGAYILSNRDELILYNGYDYYFPDSDKSLKCGLPETSFTYVMTNGNEFLRTNYLMPYTEIVLERIIDNGVETKLLFPAIEVKNTIVGVNGTNVISLLETSSEDKLIKFYDIEENMYHKFYYKVKDGEEIIGAYCNLQRLK